MKIRWVMIIFMMSINGWTNEVDPLMPPWMKGSKTPEVKQKVVQKKEQFYLRQIVKHENGRSAVINGFVLKEGEYIRDARVNKIEDGSVELIRGNKKWKLSLGEKTPRVRR